MERELVTIQNLANLIGITKRAVQKHITAGNLKAELVGNQYLIEAKEALAFAVERIAYGRERKRRLLKKITEQNRPNSARSVLR
jgi:excisionase family DNA binding protein